MTDAKAAGPDGQSGPAREQTVIEEESGQAEAAMGETDPTKSEATPVEVVEAEVVSGDIVDGAIVDGAKVDGTVNGAVGEDGAASGTDAKPAPAEPAPKGVGAELEALRSELDERLRDLQRVTAEYANYRRRVDRDRGAVVEQATGLVISSLLPILDDLDRAREHDDLVGPSAAMAEQLHAALAKFGLTGFGEVGDGFDPTRHEAVAHQTSADVTEPTCVAVMRRGYLLGDRLLRAALVAVADPE